MNGPCRYRGIRRETQFIKDFQRHMFLLSAKRLHRILYQHTKYHSKVFKSTVNMHKSVGIVVSIN